MIVFGVQLLALLVSVIAEEELLVKTKQGILQGTNASNIVTEEPFYAFYNIPYALPPVGERRFKDPEPPEPWEGIRDAKEEGNGCMSVNPIFKSVEGSEDCLYLNIYTPQPPNKLKESPLPVMVWIYGGAFHGGSATQLFYGPDFLLLEDIIVVTFNYRINVFGFLSLQNEAVPGNAGLKDQVMALKWIRSNIRSFGGDPDQITIFGQSAGAASVHYLMLSPLGKGLFHKAIAQSGTAICPWASTNYTIEAAQKLGKVFNCDSVNEDDLLKCLQGLTSEELTNYQYNVFSPVLTDPTVRYTIFVPCIEPKSTLNGFITEDPRVLVQEGRFTDVPLIIGTTQMEALPLDKALTGDFLPENVVKTLYAKINRNPELFLAEKLETVELSARQRIGKQIKEFYFKDLPVSEYTIPNIINVVSDIFFGLGCHDTVQYHTKFGVSPVYQYFFTLDTNYGVVKNLLDITLKGPSHADDLGYFFFMNIAPQVIDPKENGFKNMKKIVKMWTNFAKFGNPTPDSSSNFEWKPATASNKYYLEIGDEYVLKEDVLKDRMDFWDDLRKSENLTKI